MATGGMDDILEGVFIVVVFIWITLLIRLLLREGKQQSCDSGLCCPTCNRPLEISSQLEHELAKVPAGMRYIDAPNFPEIRRLLRESAPFVRVTKEDSVTV